MTVACSKLRFGRRASSKVSWLCIAATVQMGFKCVVLFSFKLERRVLVPDDLSLLVVRVVPAAGSAASCKIRSLHMQETGPNLLKHCCPCQREKSFSTVFPQPWTPSVKAL